MLTENLACKDKIGQGILHRGVVYNEFTRLR